MKTVIKVACIIVAVIIIFTGGWYLGSNGKLFPNLSAFGKLRDSERAMGESLRSVRAEKAVSLEIIRGYEESTLADAELLRATEERLRESERIASERGAALARTEAELRISSESTGEAIGAIDDAITTGREMGSIISGIREEFRRLQERCGGEDF